MIKAINDALEREGKRLCPACNTVNDINNRKCSECETKFSRTSTPEDGL